MPADHVILILAAGGSRRLGRPKQLLEFRGKTLLRHIADEACLLEDSDVWIALGAPNEKITQTLEGSRAHIHYHHEWPQGMGATIRSGMHALIERNAALQSVILAVCDQPFLTHALLRALRAAAQETDATIVASAYAGTLGTPAYFHRRHFPELLALRGDAGAKKLLSAKDAALATVPFERGEIDIDTPADYKNLSP